MKKICKWGDGHWWFLSQKTKLIMRLSLGLFLLSCINVLAVSSSAQEARMSVKKKNAVIREVLQEIEKHSEYHFVYDNQIVDVEQVVDVDVNNESIYAILDEIFKDQSIGFKVVDNQIILYSREKTIPTYQPIQQQVETISGVVTDVMGDPLPGVNVFEKSNSINGVITGVDGSYAIRLESGDPTLVFSFIGFSSQEVNVAGRSQIDITLMEDMIGLEEVVAVGYATQKKVNLTGSVTQIKTEDMQSSAVTNTSAALQGKGAGIYISQMSGMAGEDESSIKIRGVGSLNAGQDPLVLVDGVEMDMNDVDPMDIESVSVLKDAASAAIYGSRAANGVILITTKAGKRDQPTTVKYNMYYGIQEVTSMPDMLNAYQHASLYNESLENDGLSPYFSEEDLTRLQGAIHVNNRDFPNNLSAAELDYFNTGDNGYYQDVDYAEMNFQKATIQKHYLSVEGGGENSSARLGIGYLNQEGVRVGNTAESYNIKLNYDASLMDDVVKVYSKLYYFHNEYDRGASSGGGSWSVAPWNQYYYPNGLYGGEADFADLRLGAYDITKENKIVGLIGTRINPIKDLNIVVEYSQVHGFRNTDKFSPYRETYNFWEDVYGENISEIERGSQETMKQTGTATASYKFKVHTNSHLTVLGGSSFEEFTNDNFEASRTQLINNFQPELSLGSAATMANASEATDYALASFFGRVNYNFADRYLFEFNVRADGSSRFAAGNQWGTFPSASFGWRITEESFMRNATAIDNMKLRVSYGQLGNQNIDNYAASSTLTAVEANLDSKAYPINNELETTVGLNSLANEDITWETTTMANIGVDMSFIQAFDMSLDVYQKVSEDILYRVAVPGTAGVAEGPYRNIAVVENMGWDLSFGYHKTLSNGLKLGANLNLSQYINEVTELDGEGNPVFLDDAYDSKTDKYMYVWQEGHAVNSFYGYTSGGIATQEQIDGGLIPEQGFDIEAGDLWYKDVTGDGEITDEDRGIIGDPHPDLIYALNLNAKWKGFDVSLLLEGAYGADALLYSSMYRTEFKSTNVNKSTDVLDRWTPDNLDAKYPKLSSLEDKTRVSDFYIEDASYLRGKDLTVGYTLPTSTIAKIGLKHVRVYANFRNLFTITDFRGLDPETYDINDTSRSGVIPPSRVYTFGLQVTL